MATAYNINGTSALKARNTRFQVIDCRDHARVAQCSPAREALLFEDGHLFDDADASKSCSAAENRKTIAVCAAATVITFVLCLLSIGL